jgi:hypothetical protein
VWGVGFLGKLEEIFAAVPPLQLYRWKWWRAVLVFGVVDLSEFWIGNYQKPLPLNRQLLGDGI